MSELEKLAQNRDAILLAELAGLLHNIGKLDPNFLASMAEDKTQAIVKKRWLNIPDYYFDRFVAPDINLLIEDVGDIVVKHNFSAKSELADNLKSQFDNRSDELAVDELIENWSEAKKNHPFIASQIEAIWRFYTFINSNGPLYQCFVSRRQTDLEPLEQDRQRIEEKHDRFDINSVSPRERQTASDNLKNELNQAKQKLQKERQIIIGEEKRRQENLEKKFENLVLSVVNKSQSIGQLLTLFWDVFFYKKSHDDYQRESSLHTWMVHNVDTTLSMLLILSHGEMSGSEKGSEQTSNRIRQQTPNFENMRISTAFGYETELEIWTLQKNRKRLLDGALSVGTRGISRKWFPFLQRASNFLKKGLGDTQRPINEITLWDYASSIAALFKTSIAKSFLEGQVADANQMHWRLLGVRFDGLDYILQANRMADLLGRQQKFQEVLNQICVALTQDTPIASQVYQDENGLFFVIPDSDKLTLKDLQTLINEQLEQKNFEDIRPCIDWSKNRLRGKELNLGGEIKRQDNKDRPSLNPVKIEEWWGNSITEICTVCGLRPAISRKTNYCSTCKNNRQSRIQPWLDTFNSTIWLDEVADHNGRLALITGQFHLDPWLNGTLVESLALGMDETTGQPVSKFASFPRVQRVWQTTQTFWQETKNDIKQCLTDNRRRLKIELANAPGLVTHQIYELDLHGQTRMSVLWDGSHLISTDNLSYTAIQLGIKAEDRKTPVVDAALAVGVWFEENSQSMFQLISDDEKNKQFDIQIADVTYQDTAYSTTIPILAEPRTFMALVPADKAVDIIRAIKTKYEREMGKVRNRLPLHVGAVYFQRRTPLRAALDAGRRMLDYKSSKNNDEVWTVIEDAQRGTLPGEKLYLAEKKPGQFAKTITVELERNGRSFTWYVPAMMGDGVTNDNWYPYVFFQSNVSGRQHIFQGLRPKSDGTSEECWLIHASQLKQGDEIYFTPATFDFQWLDTSARRFEIAYEKGCRRNHLNRPYLLDELDEIQAAWGMVQNLSKSQLYALRDLVETKRADWFTNPQESLEDSTFRNFCVDVIRNTQWPKKLLTAKTKEDKKTLPQKTVEQLTNWAINGLLADVVELYLSIMKKDLTGDKSNE